MKPIRDDLPNTVSAQRHLDEARLVVRLVHLPIEETEQVQGGVVCQFGGGIAVSLDEAARLSTAVAWDEEQEVFHPFAATQRFSQFEWGASGTVLEFAVDVISSVTADAVLLGIGYAVGRMRGAVKGTRTREEWMDDAGALRAAAVDATSTVFRVDRDALKVTSVRMSEHSARLKLTTDGQRFVATAKRLETGDRAIVVERLE